MKIAVASNDGKIISSHFGRTRGFVIFEIEGNEIKKREYLPNTFTGHHGGIHNRGLHHFDTHSAIIEALKDVNIVISHGMGRRLYDDLKNAGIDVYVCNETNVDEAIKLFLDGKLTNVEDLLH
ncbi:MAG: NifB/NifX family molybdenum-iron cluster-binding protein [Caldisericia bacterium]|jgi:predicted Fe-Mo cluster-binding NifX family protein|nr:NifB/NifX family molybdenum-iron cluster-binding protein [Caldisericia bacterium]